LNVFQNITSYDRYFVLPRVLVSTSGANSSDLAQILEASIKLKSPQARVSNANLRIVSSPWINSSSIQWMNETLAFTVSGVTTSQGGKALVDLSWKSFTVSSRYALGGVEANRIGETYLPGPAAFLAAVGKPSQFISWAFQVGGKFYDPSQFPDAARNVTVWDLSSFATPISKWQWSHMSLVGESWSLRANGQVGMAAIERVLEERGPATARYELSYDLAGTISAPVGARANGDVVTLVTSSLLEAVMGGVILSVVGLLLGVTIIERRFQNKTIRKKPRR
jgi:hypothetical protein